MTDPRLSRYTHVVLFDEPLPFTGGISPMATWIAAELGRRELRSVIVGGESYLSDPLYDALPVERVGLPHRIRGNLSDLRLFVLYRRLRRELGDRVILYPLILNYVKVARWMGRSLPWHIVPFLHGNEVLRSLSRSPRTLSANLDRALVAFANSRFTSGLVEGRAEGGRIEVLWPGIDVASLDASDTDWRAQRGWGDRPVILMLSRLAARKGHAPTLRAVARLADRYPRLLLAIAGSGPHRPAIEAEAARLGIVDRVDWLGRVSESDKGALFRSADVYCMPSETRIAHNDIEGFGITFVEAAACGTLCVGSRSGGIPDALDEGRAGLLVDPEAPEDLATTLDRALSEPASFDALRAYARTRARTTLRWSDRVDRMLEAVSSRLAEI